MKTRKILIIEDEKALSKVFETYFEEDGSYEIGLAFDGEEGLEKLEKFHPDLILLDVIMPKMDGITFLKKLRKMEEHKDTPVIVLTNLDDTKAMKELADLGQSLFFIKANAPLERIKRWVNKLFDERE